jgi:hypothetical protein
MKSDKPSDKLERNPESGGESDGSVYPSANYKAIQRFIEDHDLEDNLMRSF